MLLLCAGAASAQDAPRSTSPRGPSSPLEAGILEEIYQVRTNPSAYAAHLEAMLALFEGNMMRTPGGLLQTEEGEGAVREAVAALRATRAMPGLRYSPGLSAAARDLAQDQSANGGMGHNGSDGSTPADRAGRHGRWNGALSENLAYSGAAPTARDVVIQLLVDDGVPGRGHRVNVLDPDMRIIGVACASHPRFSTVCVMDHAQEYQERR